MRSGGGRVEGSRGEEILIWDAARDERADWAAMLVRREPKSQTWPEVKHPTVAYLLLKHTTVAYLLLLLLVLVLLLLLLLFLLLFLYHLGPTQRQVGCPIRRVPDMACEGR